MNARLAAVRATLFRLSARLRGGDLAQKYALAEPPLRAELFSADQMERHGRTLAEAHKVAPGRGADQLLARLADNEATLAGTYGLLRAAVKANRRITPAGEWLLDNFYLIEEQIRTARRHFPKGYSRELPLLASGPSAGLPRVYDIALEAIAHGDGHVEPESLDRFVAAYQKVVDLRLGELWAIPIMLRLALIENLRRIGARVAAATIDRNQADAWADQMIGVAERDPKSLILVIADMARSNPPLDSSFVAVLVRRLQGHSSALALPLTWIEQRLSESGQTIEQLVQSETQSQAANQVGVSNSIGSLRFLGAMDWREFVETMSTVERKLREDPGGIYAQMDFATRDRYRHVIERIAKHSGLPEIEVARKAIQLTHEGHGAEAASDGGDAGSGEKPDANADAKTGDRAPDERATHVGYYLIDKGLPQLERSAKTRHPPGERLRRMFARAPLLFYLGAIGLLTFLFAGSLVARAAADGLEEAWLAALAVPALLGGSQLAVALVNWLATLLARPQPLPRMDFSQGIPAHARSLVVVPTMLSSLQAVDELVEALEVRFLANRDARLHFGLLTDFRDAATETRPEDEALQELARTRIEALRAKYGGAQGGGGDDIFFLFHRPRRWNAQEGVWMGYERKRGKLGDLNALLRTGDAGPFSLIVGDTAILAEVKYVITLDTDTLLPRDSAREFAATMAHPLNRARYDAGRQRVCSGYGILQPRMAVNLPSTNRSRYARFCAGESGVDPYTRAVSDVYQDLFHEGSFIGKGIYDVEIFERALKGRFPENRILSHDLLEGCYARAGLLSDVQLYEDYPARYGADVSRRHRWIRGDWQIASWMLPRVPGPAGKPLRNRLSKLSQWKLIDNLRRSLVPAGLMLLFLLGWALVPSFLYWTLSVVGIVYLPLLVMASLDILKRPPEAPLRQHAFGVLRAAGQQFAQATLALAFLPYEAAYSLDAILRTSARILITHRRLLEWTPSSEQQRDLERRSAGPPGGAADFVRSWGEMWSAPAVAVAGAAGLAALQPMALLAAAPVLLLWFGAPAIAWWISRPLAPPQTRLRREQRIFLRRLARRTWAFFDHFVSARDHWLPPDNYQEHPVAVVAHRTSPTNVGLALLANLAAHDFGYLTTGRLIERTTDTLATLHALERHRGHFYNWYDTLTLKPLPPLYVSSVDSGNLAAHLLTLRPGLLALAGHEIPGERLFEGLCDTMGVLRETAAQGPAAKLPELVQLQRDIDSAFDARPNTLPAIRDWLARLDASAAALVGQSGGDAELPATPGGDVNWWAQALLRQCREALAEVDALVPWSRLPPAPGSLQEIPGLGAPPTLRDLATLGETLARKAAGAPPAEAAWIAEMQPLVAQSGRHARALIEAAEELARQLGELARMEYGFLYDKARHLLAIGYNVGEMRRDASYYDLLASEARLCSFVAIAQGQLPQENWFALGRLLTGAGGPPTLLSWSGSMFEYLMPLLVMPTYENTLLDQTCRAAVAQQIAYGRQRGIAWGMSESGYNAVDVRLNYQYRAFGVPGLGLKRGLAEDLVIAPYASALALMVAPEEACANLQRLVGEGLRGKFGLYEAVDYTPSRLPRGQQSAIVRSFMAHHQGMNILSLAYLILDRPMQRRFESDPLFQSTTLLLHERIPKVATLFTPTAEVSDTRTESSGPEMPVRVLNTADTPTPEVQLLSNGRYHVMVSNAGGGYSRYKDLAVTRWHEDATRDNWGAFCYIRDVASGAFWSAAHQPTLRQADAYEAIFTEGRAEFRRRDKDYETHTEIVVSPEDDIELRRMRITNRSNARRTVELSSYAEVVLAPPAADALHTTFSNLFVQTEIVHERQAILCTRRPRSVGEKMPWLFHLMAVHGGESGDASYETDRMRFIGRTRGVESPRAMLEAGPLSGSQGAVLDPIVAIRQRITLDAGQTATIDLVSGIGETRDAALGLVGKYRDRHLADRVFDLAWTHSWVNLQQINASESDAQLYGRLAGSVIYANPALRADASLLTHNRRGQSGLWGYAISGDLPIVLLKIGDQANIDLVRQLVQAHAYWRLKGLAVDLVIWNEDHAGYRQPLQELIMGLIAAGVEAHLADRPGGIFVRVAEQISNEDRILFQAVARAIINDTRGSLAEQVNRRGTKDMRGAPLPRLIPETPYPALWTERPQRPEPAERSERPDASGAGLRFFNGHGGFAPDGREYVIDTAPGRTTPAPWVNVIANARFGTVVSESGAAYTWSENAHEFRFTPWGDDPVGDASGEAIYLRDEDSGVFWSPTALPCAGRAPYRCRHGFGYSVFEHVEDGIRSELTVFVDPDAALKYSVLEVRNESGRARRLSATGYVEWVLGDLRAKSLMHVVSEIDPLSGALYAHNPYSSEFADRIAFFDADEATGDENVTVSADRCEFIGRNGSLANPAAMSRIALSGRVGAGLDPCAAIQVPFALDDGQTRRIIFRLGARGRRDSDASELLQRLRGPEAADNSLAAVRTFWQQTLGAIQVETPDPALDILANGWLLYQTLACRVWARSGYYQSGGAYGFRDQLQDTMALVHAAPQLLREHLLRCAGRQFAEGDVQHWWHPPSGRGVRTHCSDDLLWLPQAVCRYVLKTGDADVLDESVHFLKGRPVNPEDDSYYDLPLRSEIATSLYDHCVRAIIKALRFGEHGLPLIGSGDWNDGMNLVGMQGKGESVWLGFFLYDTLQRFGRLAEARGDAIFAARCAAEADQLSRKLEEHGWDGAWYRRAFFDDGSPLGSAHNPECRIDSIAQSWSVLSGAGDAVRARAAMDALDRHLVSREDALIRLLTPPFDKSALNPGYIKGYLPGVRENGGQYTHGAIWAAMAFAALGDRRRAWELFAMINPIGHGDSAAAIAVYKVEPYVLAADVYAVAPHVGRGGWSWYTGAAGWMYRLILESLLGLHVVADKLRFVPCLPADWPGFTLRYRHRATEYTIVVQQDGAAAPPGAGIHVSVDGVAQADAVISLIDDGRPHRIDVRM